jgi:hypothetical protein
MFNQHLVLACIFEQNFQDRKLLSSDLGESYPIRVQCCIWRLGIIKLIISQLAFQVHLSPLQGAAQILGR